MGFVYILSSIIFSQENSDFMTDYKERLNYVTNGVLMTQMQPVESAYSFMSFEEFSSDRFL